MNGDSDQNIDQSELEGKIAKYMNRMDIKDIISESIKQDHKIVTLSLNKMREVDHELSDLLMSNPLKMIPIFEKFLNDRASEIKGEKVQQQEEISALKGAPKTDFKINFDGMLGKNLVSPRGLNQSLANHFVGVQGIVTRISLVRPKLVYSAHYCEKTGQGSVKEYHDQLSIAETSSTFINGGISGNLTGANTSGYYSNVVPTKDINQNDLTFEYGPSKFKNYQTIMLQEPPERTPVGQLPRAIEVVLEGSLVDRVKPGDRVQVNGVFKCIITQSTSSRGTVKTVLIGTNVEQINIDIDKPQLTGEDIREIKALSKKDNVLEILGNSMAPGIYGHRFIKRALILQLLGGCEKNLENGTHLRGDINILMIGDPSTAKSQFLRYMLHTAPNAINTTGRGSSGVGLTAAVMVDKDTGERHLEAGAMVLGDRGVVCIDEFDKMAECDRVAIHEVMEQQTITIAKAGIHVSLNARCSVLAAANPIYGQYNEQIPLSRNIGFPDSLLSRFDLCFIVVDEHDSKLDRKIAYRVIHNHMSQVESSILGQNDGDQVIEPEIAVSGIKKSQVYIKKNKKENLEGEILSRDFLRKYIQYAKEKVQPQLTDDSSQIISEIWQKLRVSANKDDNSNKASPITVRTLESLIRLATAAAKARLSEKICQEDCVLALKLLTSSIFNATDDDDLKGDDEDQEEGQDENDESNDVKMEGDEDEKKISKKRRGKKRKPGDNEEIDEEDIEDIESDKLKKSKLKSESKRRKRSREEEDDLEHVKELMDGSPESELKENFVFKAIKNKLQKRKDTFISLDELWNILVNDDETKNLKIKKKSQLLTICEKLQNDSKIFISDGYDISLV